MRMEEILCNVWSVTLGENVSIQISGCRTQLRTNKVTTNNNNKTVMTGSPTDRTYWKHINFRQICRHTVVVDCGVSTSGYILR